MKRSRIEDVLLEIGIPASSKGFTYITDAIILFDKKGPEISVMKELYPTIAKMRGATPSKVERGIRYSLEVARSEKGNQEAARHYIGNTHCTNSNSLRQLYMMLKREEGEEI